MTPKCAYGYPLSQLRDELGDARFVKLDAWMTGQTGAICDELAADCGERHGFVYFTWDVERWMQQEKLQVAKHKDRVRSHAYLHYIHEHSCLKCANYPVEAHHTVSRKWADGSDLLCVPLCRYCHARTSSKEDFSFETSLLQNRYMERRGLKCEAGETFEAMMLREGLARRGDDSDRANRKPYQRL